MVSFTHLEAIIRYWTPGTVSPPSFSFLRKALCGSKSGHDRQYFSKTYKEGNEIRHKRRCRFMSNRGTLRSMAALRASTFITTHLLRGSGKTQRVRKQLQGSSVHNRSDGCKLVCCLNGQKKNTSSMSCCGGILSAERSFFRFNSPAHLRTLGPPFRKRR